MIDRLPLQTTATNYSNLTPDSLLQRSRDGRQAKLLFAVALRDEPGPHSSVFL